MSRATSDDRPTPTGRTARDDARPFPTAAFLAVVAVSTLLLSGGFLSGCSVPTEEARIVEDVPEEVLGTLASTTTIPLDEDADSVGVRFYFHDENEVMVRVVRRYPDPPLFQDTLRELLEGPRDEEQAPPAFIQAAGSPALAPVLRDLDGGTGTAYIRVADEAGFRETENRRIAAAEIVCTAVQYTNVTGIVIEDSLGPIPLTDLDANPIAGAATASDYDDCQTQLPLPSPATTSSDS